MRKYEYKTCMKGILSWKCYSFRDRTHGNLITKQTNCRRYSMLWKTEQEYTFWKEGRRMYSQTEGKSCGVFILPWHNSNTKKLFY